jgi:hypothetical protein
MKTDFDRSLDRVVRSEEQRAKLTGFGTTKQGQALARQYIQQLADSIRSKRATGRPKPVWKALHAIGDRTWRCDRQSRASLSAPTRGLAWTMTVKRTSATSPSGLAAIWVFAARPDLQSAPGASICSDRCHSSGLPRAMY